MATILTYICIKMADIVINVVYLMPTDMFWDHLHKENSKNQKVENDQNSKWPPFWRTSKMANCIII